MPELVPSQQQTDSRILWIQLLAGPVLWSVHFLASYLLVEAACQAGWNVSILGLNGLSFMLSVLTILAVIGALLFARRSYGGWKDRHRDDSLRQAFRERASWFEGTEDFMYFSGLLLSVLFAAAILMVGVPAVFLQPC